MYFLGLSIPVVIAIHMSMSGESAFRGVKAKDQVTCVPHDKHVGLQSQSLKTKGLCSLLALDFLPTIYNHKLKASLLNMIGSPTFVRVACTGQGAQAVP